MKNNKKTVILFGGSFNPPHIGHFETGAYLYKTFKPDEVWMLLSVNPDKDANKYASLEHRIAMGKIMAAHHPEVPFVISDAEDHIGKHETYDVLMALKETYPDHQFIWAMGVDNLLTFEHWSHAAEIFENFPVVVLNRPPFTEQMALACPMAKTYPHLRCNDPANFLPGNAGWMLVDNPQVNFSSHEFLDDLKQGVACPSQPMEEIAAYIREHNLYEVTGMRAAPAPAIPALKPL